LKDNPSRLLICIIFLQIQHYLVLIIGRKWYNISREVKSILSFKDGRVDTEPLRTQREEWRNSLKPNIKTVGTRMLRIHTMALIFTDRSVDTEPLRSQRKEWSNYIHLTCPVPWDFTVKKFFQRSVTFFALFDRREFAKNVSELKEF